MKSLNELYRLTANDMADKNYSIFCITECAYDLGIGDEAAYFALDLFDLFQKPPYSHGESLTHDEKVLALLFMAAMCEEDVEGQVAEQDSELGTFREKVHVVQDGVFDDDDNDDDDDRGDDGYPQDTGFRDIR